jgi:multidrug resistance protein, MATE family
MRKRGQLLPGQKAARGIERQPIADEWLTYGRVLALSLPIILSNVTTPLLGVTNTAVIGQLGEAHLIGAVAIGAQLFSLLFWAFGFLRMGTTGLTAQATGAGDTAETNALLARALLIAGAAGLALIILQHPLAWACLAMIKPSAAVEENAQAYFAIRIWSAPFALANYALLGWFIGLGKTRTALFLQLALNGANIVLNLVLVSVLGWGVPGVAAGTLIAEGLAAAFGLTLAFREIGGRGAALPWSRTLDRSGLVLMMAVNTDLLLRTLSLLFVFTFFTAQAARSGDVILAANEVLLLFLSVSAYLLDGFAFATEVLTGRAIGAARADRFRDAVKLSSVWAVGIAFAVSLLYTFFGTTIVDALTTNAAVRETARLYLPWAVAAPAIGVACFQLDGIFIGATRTRDMRNMILLSLVIFLAAWAALTPAFGNHGLWASLLVFFVARAVTLALHYPALQRAAFLHRP